MFLKVFLFNVNVAINYNVFRLGKVAERKASLELQMFKFKKNMSNEVQNGNFAKPMLAEVFVGSIDEIREHFSRKYCRIYGIDENNWKYIAPSSIDGLKVRNKDNGFEFSFWAGGSGTNNMAVDKTGGCHDLSFHRSYTFEVVV